LAVVVTLLLFFASLALMVVLRQRTHGKIKISATDVLVAMVPVALWLLLTGRIADVGVGGVTLKSVDRPAAKSAVRAQVSPADIERFTQLKAFHLKFIEDFTARNGETWNADAYRRSRDQGELLFRQAIEYTKVWGDSTREKVLDILHEQFKITCELIERDVAAGKGGVPPDVAKLAGDIIARNYDYAIRGEFSGVSGTRF
jgi:arylamine N-acetyltransferase